MIPGADLLQAARADGVGVHVTPSSVFCLECQTDQLVVGFAGTCPDELKCGHTYISHDEPRCTYCGWPKTNGEPIVQGRCGDGVHGCVVPHER